MNSTTEKHFLCDIPIVSQGSFFIPMLVMVYVYLRISCVVASRHDDMVQIKIHQVSSYQSQSIDIHLLILLSARITIFSVFHPRTAR